MTVVLELDNGMQLRMWANYPDEIKVELSDGVEVIGRSTEKAADMRKGMAIIIGKAVDG